jgi:hypothetical protein
MDKFMKFEVQPNRIPVEAYWDQQDARLLAIETEYAKAEGKGSDLNGEEQKGTGTEGGPGSAAAFNAIKESEIEDDFRKQKEEFEGKTLETYFVTTDYEIKKQDVVKFEEGEETLLGVHVPYFYYMGRRPETDEEEEEDETQTEAKNSMIILRKPMKDFVGLENVE